MPMERLQQRLARHPGIGTRAGNRIILNNTPFNDCSEALPSLGKLVDKDEPMVVAHMVMYPLVRSSLLLSTRFY
jgi:predicted DNA-binding helix-hairpin-helix protein